MSYKVIVKIVDSLLIEVKINNAIIREVLSTDKNVSTDSMDINTNLGSITLSGLIARDTVMTDHSITETTDFKECKFVDNRLTTFPDLFQSIFGDIFSAFPSINKIPPIEKIPKQAPAPEPKTDRDFLLDLANVLEKHGVMLSAREDDENIFRYIAFATNENNDLFPNLRSCALLGYHLRIESGMSSKQANQIHQDYKMKKEKDGCMCDIVIANDSVAASISTDKSKPILREADIRTDLLKPMNEPESKEVFGGHGCIIKISGLDVTPEAISKAVAKQMKAKPVTAMTTKKITPNNITTTELIDHKTNHLNGAKMKAPTEAKRGDINDLGQFSKMVMTDIGKATSNQDSHNANMLRKIDAKFTQSEKDCYYTDDIRAALTIFGAVKPAKYLGKTISKAEFIVESAKLLNGSIINSDIKIELSKLVELIDLYT